MFGPAADAASPVKEYRLRHEQPDREDSRLVQDQQEVGPTPPRLNAAAAAASVRAQAFATEGAAQLSLVLGRLTYVVRGLTGGPWRVSDYVQTDASAPANNVLVVERIAK